ncbi:MAG: hypothetical protein IPP35_11310 [Elusimicrobia bacterium]|nr:hypothetical protein [Elusimicrobiota bacterium]
MGVISATKNQVEDLKEDIAKDSQTVQPVDVVLWVKSIDLLRSVGKNVGGPVFVTGYYVSGDGGGSLFYCDPTDVVSSDNGGSVIVANDGGRWKVIHQGFLTARQWGAHADNHSDDAPYFQAGMAWCGAKGLPFKITAGQYVLGSRITVVGPIQIASDESALIRFTDPNSCGFLFDNSAGVEQLASLQFPSLLSPAVNSSFSIPGYGPTTYTYDLNSRTGQAIELRGNCNRLAVRLFYAAGWESGIKINATNTVMANLDISANTLDFCKFGVWLTGTAGGVISGVSFIANTLWAQFPFYLDSTNILVNQSKFEVTGGAYVNEEFGAGVYGAATNNQVDTCKFIIRWLYAGHAVDSTVGVPATLQVPYLAGAGTSNGQLTDGNATVGYWTGTFCEFDIGAVLGVPGGRGGQLPVAGDVIRVRDAGGYNTVRIAHADNVAAVPIPVSAVVGESNYNGGVGAAPFSKAVLCSAAIGALPPGTSAVFYMYHQCLSSANDKPIGVTDIGNGLNAQGILAAARWQGSANNRQIAITFTNPSTVKTTAAATYFFWVEL